MLNKSWITLPVVYRRPLPQKRFFGGEGKKRKEFAEWQELELPREEQEARFRQQELQLELLGKQAEKHVQISQTLMTMMQNLVKK